MECPVCAQHLFDAWVVSECGHSVCGSCSEKIQSCPICRHSLRPYPNWVVRQYCESHFPEEFAKYQESQPPKTTQEVARRLTKDNALSIDYIHADDEFVYECFMAVYKVIGTTNAIRGLCREDFKTIKSCVVCPADDCYHTISNVPQNMLCCAATCKESNREWIFTFSGGACYNSIDTLSLRVQCL